MPTDTYALLEHAILHRLQVVARYDGTLREFCPHALGRKGRERHVMAFQFGGASQGGLPPGGDWRCFAVDRLSDAGTRPGAWHTAPNLFNPQSCLDAVDLVVQPLPPADAEVR